jgi:hypothetical protein
MEIIYIMMHGDSKKTFHSMKQFNSPCHLIFFVIQNNVLLNLFIIIGEWYYFYLQNKQYINLRKFVKFVCQMDLHILTQNNSIVIAGLKEAKLSHILDLFLTCLSKTIHIPRINNYYYTVGVHVFIFLHIASRESFAVLGEFSVGE